MILGNKENPPEPWVVEEWNEFQLAKRLGVPWWELLRQPDWVRARAKFYQDVEDGVKEAKHVN